MYGIYELVLVVYELVVVSAHQKTKLSSPQFKLLRGDMSRRTAFATLLSVAASLQATTAFAPLPAASRARSFVARPSNDGLLSAESAAVGSSSSESGPSVDKTESLEMPVTFEEMVRDASAAMAEAYQSGMSRQTVRVLLPRDPSNDQIGQQYESDANVFGNTNDLVLAPPDETWQGGSPQLYRALAPTCREILRRISGEIGGVPPRIVEDRNSVDESGVDGIGILMTQSKLPSDDICAFVQPSQETIDAVDTLSEQAGNRLVVLMNPQWRNVDDALDVASKNGGVFGGLASFLGGKGVSLQRLDEMGFDNAYTIEGYVCRGGNIRMVKRFDSDWVVFAGKLKS